MHQALLLALRAPRGLVFVTGPTGQGKTTAIDQVLSDPECPSNVTFLGDLRGAIGQAQHAVALARSSIVLAVLRIPRASGAFARMIDMGVPASEIAEVTNVAFSTRLVRSSSTDVVLLHEQLNVTSAIRALIVAGADSEALHRAAIAEGMCSLRELAVDLVRSGRLTTSAFDGTVPGD